MKFYYPLLALTTMLIPIQSLACSIREDFPYHLKNDLVTQFLGDHSIQAQIDNVTSISIHNYEAQLFYTFSDRGADCPDSVELKGTISSTFRRPIRYNEKKARMIYDRVSEGDLSQEDAELALSKIEICSVSANIISRKVPSKRGEIAYYSTTLNEIDPISCRE